MNKQAQDNMLSVIQNFLANVPPACDVEISMKYNLSRTAGQYSNGSTFRMTTPGMNEMQDSSNKSERRRSKPSTPVMSRKLRSEEKVSLQNAVPLFSPDKKTDPTTYEPISPAVRKEEKNKDEVNVSAEGFDKGPKDRLPPPKPNKPASKSSDQETDDMATSELFPAKKALRYNKNSGKYDDISY